MAQNPQINPDVNVSNVMKDIEMGKLVQGTRSTCTSDADEIRYLAGFDGGTDAFALLQLLRAEHSARCDRGETFVLVLGAMVKARAFGKWSERRYRKARDLLLNVGLLVKVSDARFRVAAEYVLADRSLTPSIRQSPELFNLHDRKGDNP